MIVITTTTTTMFTMTSGEKARTSATMTGTAASDYRHYRLSEPPRGYEWREVDGNYVLAAVATGVIASVVIAAAASH